MSTPITHIMFPMRVPRILATHIRHEMKMWAGHCAVSINVMEDTGSFHVLQTVEARGNEEGIKAFHDFVRRNYARYL